MEIASHTPRIAAVFATMNRSATAVACVRALAVQTRPPELVVVADNRSEDGTAADLEALEGLPFALEVLRMADNAGNAGGVAAAMAWALEQGADAVWILDDDSWPRPPALAALLAGDWDLKTIRHAHQVDPATGALTWPLQIRDGADGWRMIWHPDELPEAEWVETRISWTGALVPRAACEAAGPVPAELFIRGEDEEYPLRLAAAGYGFRACRDAVMDHPGPADLAVWHFLGKRLFYERGLADVKLYYKVRNMVWIKKRHEGGLKALAMALAYAAAAIRLDGPQRLPLLLRSIRHGWLGRLGRMDRA
jgi:rhamnopyranosyl-N-acetylglucosaminyl-diphospho-decaprenol beta-1,3/1,4-galactofuranosyltransferase